MAYNVESHCFLRFTFLMEDVNIAASEFNLFIRTQIDRERGTHIRGNKEYHTFAIYIIKYLMFDGEMSNVSS